MRVETVHSTFVIGGPHMIPRPERTMRGREAAAPVGGAGALVELLGRLPTARDVPSACEMVADHFQRELKCHSVALGLCPPRRQTCRLQAVSGSPGINRGSELARAIEAALDEGIVRNELGIWPPLDDSRAHSLLAHKRLAELAHVGQVISGPLRDSAGRLQGAWVVLGTPDSADAAATLRYLESAAIPVAGGLGLLRRAHGGVVRRTLSRMSSRWLSRRCVLGWMSAAVVVGAMALPVPHRIHTHCELQPVTRRFVAAPFEGTLERCAVQPGDLIEANQVLARMDGREVEWELAGTQADFQRASKQRDAHMAAHEVGAARRAQFEMERLELDARLLQHRSDTLDIKSPLSGIVVSGDLKRAEGVRLTMGQALFEIAPLDRMLVELAVPESDIGHVAEGSEVQMVLEAFPTVTWRGTIERIHPRTEIRDDEHVFVAEAMLENADGTLRPGMRGRGKILAASQPLGWCLFHKAWEQLLLRWGW